MFASWPSQSGLALSHIEVTANTVEIVEPFDLAQRCGRDPPITGCSPEIVASYVKARSKGISAAPRPWVTGPHAVPIRVVGRPLFATCAHGCSELF